MGSEMCIRDRNAALRRSRAGGESAGLSVAVRPFSCTVDPPLGALMPQSSTGGQGATQSPRVDRTPFLQLRRASSIGVGRLGSGGPQLMAKGDGKQRRPKASNSAEASPQQTSESTSQPGRVTSDSLLSARKQIALVRAYRARQNKGAPKPKQRTSFRKKTGADSAVAEAAADLGELPEGKYNVSAVPLLLVDGYNVIGHWPRLKKRRDNDDMNGARQMLLDDLVSYNSPKRYDIVVVFDAVPSPGDRLDSYLGLGIVWTPSADLYIETELKRIAAEGERPVWAATGDGQIQVAARTYGANLMTTKRLVSEIKGSRAATPALVNEWNRHEAQRRPVFLFDQLGGVERDVLAGKAPNRKLSQRERKLLEEQRRGR